MLEINVEAIGRSDDMDSFAVSHASSFMSSHLCGSPEFVWTEAKGGKERKKVTLDKQLVSDFGQRDRTFSTLLDIPSEGGDMQR